MPKILIVEDIEENFEMLARRLRRRGFEIAAAADGLKALSQARDEAPDLILMDMNLPELDGWEATRRLKADPATRAIPVIALTAHGTESDREKVFQAGCDDHHAKPVDLTRLLAQIEAHLKRPAR